MGSPERPPLGNLTNNERPQHRARVDSFAMSKTEITFQQWDTCAADGGCQGNAFPSGEGWGRGDRPVINVSWDDALEYVTWLNSKVDGASYRLPTEIEWEYAARAGSTSDYFWGEEANVVDPTQICAYANVHDATSKRINRFVYRAASCDDGYAKTAPVASYAPNAFGLYDMSGNVGEWTNDCGREYRSDRNYAAQVCNNRIKRSEDRRVVRGGDWKFYPRAARSAYRDEVPFRDHYRNNLGIRVVKNGKNDLPM